jgi:hypothetical protein
MILCRVPGQRAIDESTPGRFVDDLDNAARCAHADAPHTQGQDHDLIETDLSGWGSDVQARAGVDLPLLCNTTFDTASTLLLRWRCR